MSALAIDLRGVCVTFGLQRVLDYVDLSIEAHDYVALIGPNGGGKTTLLKVVLGLVRPDEGEVKVLGASPREARGRIGYVPQYARFDFAFPVSVLDVVLMGRLRAERLLRGRGAGDRAAGMAILEQLEIADLASRQVGLLSGGQIQRVLIARALVMDPELLLLDEPTASLDVQSEEGFYELLAKLSERMTVIISTHDITGVSARVSSIACLNRRLFFHPASELTAEVVAQTYGCPVELLAHGVPHRVLGEHESAERRK